MNEFIDKFKGGLNHIVNATNLARGEVQTILFIRALLKDAIIYIFDEPTNYFDFKMEKIFLNFFSSISKNKILIMSTHKTKNLNIFNKIIDLNNE